MILTIHTKSYGDINIIVDDNIWELIPANYLNVEYNKSKKNYYVYFCHKGNKYRLHRYLLNAPKGMVVDHINGDTKDNRLENLRVCTQKENLQNRLDSLYFPPTKSNKLGIRGLFLLYDKHDKRWYYKFKLKGYKTKYFCLKRKDEAYKYARNPERMENEDETLFN